MDKIIVALDNMDKDELNSFLATNAKKLKTVKIGLELFTRYGKNLVEEINQKYPSIQIFLDLKYHDIPSTVAKSIRSLEGLKIHYLTIHLSGSEQMIKEALISRDQYIPGCKLLGVSILTSLGEREIQETFGTSREILFKHLYTQACQAKIDAIVCSGHELCFANNIERTQSHSPLKICPGIRFEGDSSDDQSRVMTPKEAFEAGADLLVIGRSITNNPKVLDQIDKYLS